VARWSIHTACGLRPERSWLTFVAERRRAAARQAGGGRQARAGGPQTVRGGGCRALTADGRQWSCYLGEAAVRQKIIAKDFLGQHSEGPGVG
jgi:hypothetical protein